MARTARHFRDLLPVAGRVRYLMWHICGDSRPCKVRLKSGERFIMRPPPANDFGTAHEVFFENVYRFAGALDRPVHRIVDLGANVGYSCIYLLHRFPAARLIAFEPHPLHVHLLEKNLELNGFLPRVKVIPAAAGARVRGCYLSDAGSSSALRSSPASDTIAVRCVDFFACVGAEPIDILKIDIEGGEYEILEDRRFALLSVRRLVLEWHAAGGVVDGERRCLDRLRALGYDAAAMISARDHGIVCAASGPRAARKALDDIRPVYAPV